MYINRFYWILLVIKIDRAHVTVFDSRRKPQDDYQDMIDILNKVWGRFRKKQRGDFPQNLTIKTNFKV